MALKRRASAHHSGTSLYLIIAAALFLANSAFAHSPHHVIDDLEVSPGYTSDTTLYVLVHNYLLRSEDRASNWQPLSNGIDTPFVLTDIALSGHFVVDDTLFVASSGGGVFKSADRGDTWRPFNTGLRRDDIGMLLVVADDGEQYLFAAGSSRGLFMSPVSDSGWSRVLSDDVQITALAAIDDERGRTVFAGDSNGGLWRSGPGFRDWQRVASLDTAGAITALAQDPKTDGGGAMLAGTAASGILRMSADGAVVGQLPHDWPQTSVHCSRSRNPGIRDIETSADGSRILFTTWSDGLYATDDDGDTWIVKDEGLRCNSQADNSAFGTPHFRDLAIPAANSDWFIGSFEGLFRSVDQGETWVPVETMPISLVRGLGISGERGDGHALLLMTYGGGAYLTTDLGESWTIMNRGLVTTRLADAEFAPLPWDEGQLYALSRGRVLSSPGADTAWKSNSLADRSWLGRVQRRLFGAPGQAAAWPMQIELSPNFANDQTMLLGFRRNGIWLSTDGGESWQRDWDGPTDYVTDMDISPDFADDGTVFAAIRGAGIYVTRDRSSTWEAVNEGFEFLADEGMVSSPNQLVDPPLVRAITDVVLALSPGYARDRTVFAGSAAGLFRSADSGQTWQSLAVFAAADSMSVVGLAVSPEYESDQTLIVSVKGRGLYRSTDGGQSFVATGNGLHLANAEPRFLAFSPHYASDNVIYAASDWSVWRSRDKGATWTRLDVPVRYEDWRGDYEGPVWFTGDWQREPDAGASATVQTTTGQKGATATLHFTGSEISWYGERGPQGGSARVMIDGKQAGTVELQAEQLSVGERVFSIAGLGNGMHEILVETLGGRVTIDNFDVSP